MQLRYTGPADQHVMSAEDWEAAGFKHAETVWDESNDWTADVSATAGKKLMEDGWFEDVTDASAAPKSDTATSGKKSNS